ncbi:phosphoglycerate dehydrogenase [Cohnella caldifontis]|uniref:phosphoglycerate dehydrogenase n=1 Tax=Cohnella caldifontis TaxID=3027471 RepID=UPI0023EA9FDD|nr:phosphoglycerate dehydrogenase [Cohnella sp. YIM B05605]
MKVVSTSSTFARYSDEPIRLLEAEGIQVVRIPPQAEGPELWEAVKDADAMIVAYTPVDDRLLEQAPRLQIVCKHGVGVDNIDLEAAKRRGVWVTNVPDGNATAVADFTFGLLLALARRIEETSRRTKAGEWPQVLGGEVGGKTLGVVGLGRIGKEVVRRARGFGMSILAFDPYPDQRFAEEYGVSFVTLEELLRQSDYITLHMPLTETTRHLIGAAELGVMKRGSFLVNASRGGLVDESALYGALKEGRLAGAALDVFEHEPAREHPLFSLDNFIATPHAAGYTREAITNVGVACARNVADVLVRRLRPASVVNGL